MHKWKQNNVRIDAVNRSEYQFKQHDKYRLTKYKIIIVIRNAENGSNIKSNAVLSRIMEIHCRFNSEFSKHNKYTRIEHRAEENVFQMHRSVTMMDTNVIDSILIRDLT